jgi:tripartite-type tricarboxylate transporter receptor subunit TctC
MKTKIIFRILFGIFFVAFLSYGTGLAADYPSKPITLIIPLGAGGSHDLNARVFTSVIPEYLNQAMVIKLMPGAGGQIGTAAAVRAKPDGYTLLFTHNFIDQLQPLVEKLPYDTTDALVTVWRLNYGTPIVYLRSDKPWKTFEELIDYAKKNPGKLRFAHTGKWGAGFTPMAILLNKAGVEVSFVPYKGGGPALQAALAGDVDFTMGFPAQGLPHYESGKLRFLGVAANQRLKEAPEVPTLKELGYPVDSMFMSRIIMAPRKTPPERLQALRDAFLKIYKDKTFLRLMARLGENLEYMDSPEYEKIRANQKLEYTELVKKLVGP